MIHTALVLRGSARKAARGALHFLKGRNKSG
jgi:hypothetical protein